MTQRNTRIGEEKINSKKVYRNQPRRALSQDIRKCSEWQGSGLAKRKAD